MQLCARAPTWHLPPSAAQTVCWTGERLHPSDSMRHQHAYGGTSTQQPDKPSMQLPTAVTGTCSVACLWLCCVHAQAYTAPGGVC